MNLVFAFVFWILAVAGTFAGVGPWWIGITISALLVTACVERRECDDVKLGEEFWKDQCDRLDATLEKSHNDSMERFFSVKQREKIAMHFFRESLNSDVDQIKVAYRFADEWIACASQKTETEAPECSD